MGINVDFALNDIKNIIFKNEKGPVKFTDIDQIPEIQIILDGGKHVDVHEL